MSRPDYILLTGNPNGALAPFGQLTVNHFTADTAAQNTGALYAVPSGGNSPATPAAPIPPAAVTNPEIDCGVAQNDGGYFGNFPVRTPVDLGTLAGTVELAFNAFSIPDRFIVYVDGAVVIDTGFVTGLSDGPSLDSYNAQLNALGFPSATPNSSPGTMTFEKAAGAVVCFVDVYAPLDGTAWTFVCGCPS